MTVVDQGSQKGSWFAVQTKPRYERIASTLLTEKGLECLLPIYLDRRRWSDRIKTLVKPLFPSYFFYRAQSDSVTSVLATSGVLRIVGFANRPVAIAHSEIEAVQRVVNSGLAIWRHDFFQVGNRVRLHSGPLAGTEGFLMKRKSKHRFIVSVELLRRAVSVEVDPQWLERLPSPLPREQSRANCGRQVATA